MIITIPIAYPCNLFNFENLPVVDEFNQNAIGVIMGKSELVYGLRCAIFSGKFDLSNLDSENYYFEHYSNDNKNWKPSALIIRSK